jgi:hypothetical protein
VLGLLRLHADVPIATVERATCMATLSGENFAKIDCLKILQNTSEIIIAFLLIDYAD